jgi:hypothetical protein
MNAMFLRKTKERPKSWAAPTRNTTRRQIHRSPDVALED